MSIEMNNCIYLEINFLLIRDTYRKWNEKEAQGITFWISLIRNRIL
jgi:hypothetical protein